MSNHIDVVALFFRASEESDIPTALDCFTEDGVWIDPDGKPYAGSDIEPYLRQQIDLLHQFNSKGVTVNYTPFVQEGNRVYVGASVNEADGTQIRRFVDVFEMRDGKIAVKDVFAKS